MLLSFEGAPRGASRLGPSSVETAPCAIRQRSGSRRAFGTEPGASRAAYLENCIAASRCALSSRYEGHAVDALASGADEGRGRLR